MKAPTVAAGLLIAVSGGWFLRASEVTKTRKVIARHDATALINRSASGLRVTPEMVRWLTAQWWTQPGKCSVGRITIEPNGDYVFLDCAGGAQVWLVLGGRCHASSGAQRELDVLRMLVCSGGAEVQFVSERPSRDADWNRTFYLGAPSVVATDAGLASDGGSNDAFP